MLLAGIALAAQIAANTPRGDVNRPCADLNALCRISPFFCPGAYPKDLDPCYADSRPDTSVVNRSGSSSRNAAPAPAPAASAPTARGRAVESPRVSVKVNRER